MRNRTILIPALYIMLILIWSSTWMFIKVSIGDTPLFMAAIRFFIASALLYGVQFLRKRPLRLPAGALKVIIILGFGNFFIGYGLTYWGMQYVYSNVASLLWATMPVQVALFAHVMLQNEKINFANIFSLVGALIGSYLMFDIHGQNFDPQVAIGMAVILFSISGTAYSNVFYKRQGSHLDPVTANTLGMLIGGVMLLISGLILEPWDQIEFTLLNLGATAYLALLGSAIGFTAYFWLFKHVTVVKMSYITFLIPILAGIWGWVLLGEVLSQASLIGALIILLAVFMPETGFFRRFKVRG